MRMELVEALERNKKTDRTEDEATYLNRMGRVYALIEDKETAKAKFEEAISLLPEDHLEALDSKKRLEDLEQNN